MSLRARLLTAIFVALLISFSLGAALATWNAAHTVQEELTASLGNARDATLAAVAGSPTLPELRRIVGAFDGSRHMRAALLAPDGAVLAASTPAAGTAPPGWFLRLVSPVLPAVTTSIQGVGALRLTADPVDEAAERWSELRERVASFAVFFAVAAVLCSLTIGRGLAPLTELAAGFARVGRGELSSRLPEAGPPEIAVLAAAFNRMAAALHEAEARNQTLSQQVATIAEEERAEIARDLHDEIGPLLFAITAFAAAIGRKVAARELDAVPAQLQAIQDSTASVQREVRDMLGRLHEGGTVPADLGAALGELVAFWRGVRPDTEFTAAAAVGAVPEAARECLFRAAQEGVSNAVRHGRPRHVRVDAGVAAHQAFVSVQDDGAGGPEGPGFGLAGMRARAASLGGAVEIERGDGWRVTVRVPVAAT